MRHKLTRQGMLDFFFFIKPNGCLTWRFTLTVSVYRLWGKARLKIPFPSYCIMSPTCIDLQVHVTYSPHILFAIVFIPCVLSFHLHSLSCQEVIGVFFLFSCALIVLLIFSLQRPGACHPGMASVPFSHLLWVHHQKSVPKLHPCPRGSHPGSEVWRAATRASSLGHWWYWSSSPLLFSNKKKCSCARGVQF